MSGEVLLDLYIEEPVMLELTIDPPIYINPTPSPAEPLFEASEAFKFVSGDKAKYDSFVANGIGTGEKYSHLDQGVFGEMSLTDDYLYICVATGTPGNAKWKKVVLFNSD